MIDLKNDTTTLLTSVGSNRVPPPKIANPVMRNWEYDCEHRMTDLLDKKAHLLLMKTSCSDLLGYAKCLPILLPSIRNLVGG
jgi:hypothetical protein